MTASVDELRALPWAKLIAESESTSCDHLHSTLMKWLRPGTLSAEQSAIWHQIEPILGLFIQLDVGASRPFFPRAVAQRPGGGRDRGGAATSCSRADAEVGSSALA